MKSLTFPSGVGGDQTRAKRRVNVNLTFIRWTQTRLDMLDVEVGSCLPTC